MDSVIENLQTYVYETLGLSLRVEKWRVEKKYPIVLRELCSFFRVDILGVQYLVMVINSPKDSSPIYARKMIDLVSDYWDGDVIYLLPRVTSYNRKRLVERKISFIVPGSQLYLPVCGMDLREHFRRLRVQKKKFSPSTQVILLSLLYGHLAGQITPSSLAEKFQYTSMTMSRGLDELTAEGLFSQQTQWRQRIVYFEGGRKELWDSVKDRMNSPVKKRYHILPPSGKIDLPLVVAGESALSRYNMLAKPMNPVYAVSGESWKILSKIDGVIELEDNEPDSIVVEVWKYRPELFSKKNLIDPISLYLSMPDSAEEETRAALGKLITFIDGGLRSTQGSLKGK